MKREEIRARIEEIAIVPAVRVGSADEARYAAETVCRSGIPIAEITMTEPGALEVIADLVKNFPEMNSLLAQALWKKWWNLRAGGECW